MSFQAPGIPQKVEQSTKASAIEAAWFSSLPLAEVAADSRVTIAQVTTIWDCARREGRLPAGTRPHHLQARPRLLGKGGGVHADSADTIAFLEPSEEPLAGFDGRPSVLTMPGTCKQQGGLNRHSDALHDSDPLLDRLRLHHKITDVVNANVGLEDRSRWV